MLTAGNIFAQEWKQNLPSKSKSELTIFDYQNAFYTYWKPYDVVNGYYTDSNGNKNKVPGWKQFKRWEYFWKSRVEMPTGKFPKSQATAAYDVYKRQLAQNQQKNAWTSLGPSTTEGGYYGLGRLSVVAFHPTNTNIYWVGAPAGGLWKTVNNGNSWTPLTESNDVLGVSAIAVPSDYETSKTLYIGTGDRDAFDNHSIGVLKTTDEGATWQTTGLTFEAKNGESVNALAVLPSSDNTIFCASSNGFYISVDAGDSWTQTSDVEFIDFEFAPSQTTVMYGATRRGTIYKSTNTGESWDLIFNTGIPNRVELAVSADAPERVYALSSNTAQGLHGIYRSDDFGENFSLIFDSQPLLNWSTNGTGTNDGQAWYDLAFASNPINADELYVGGVNTWKSTNGGSSWTLANHWYGGGGAQDVHADKHYFTYHPTTGELFECNDGGLYKTANGSNWQHISNSLVISQMYGLSTAQTDNDITITGLQDNGTKARFYGQWYDVLGGDGMKCLIDPHNADIQYASQQYGSIYKTDDGWNSGFEVSANIPGGANGAWVTPMAIDGNNPETIYIGYSSLWRSNDGGYTFSDIAYFGEPTAITVAPSNSNIILVAHGSSLTRSQNGGATWTTIAVNVSDNGDAITDITVKHDNPNTIWITLGGYDSHGVYETTNGGNSWTNISEGLPEIPVNTIIQNRIESVENQLYIGTDFGVYVKNGNENWMLYGTGMPKVVVSELDIFYDIFDPQSSRLRASTYGRGLWEIPMELSGNFAPLLQTGIVSEITTNSAQISGEIIDNYGADIYESGFVLSTLPNPYLGNENVQKIVTEPNISIGQFLSPLSELQPGTTFYFKAFATGNYGTGYGSEYSFTTLCSKISEIAYFQDFETNGILPNCWSQSLISGENFDWNVGEFSIYTAFSGSSFMYIDDNTISDDLIRLKFPMFDFSTFTDLVLTFNHFQPSLFSFQDILSVIYRSNTASEWQTLAEYTSNTATWTERSIELPELSDTYELAFLANMKNGRGIGIDNLKIDLPGNTNILSDQIQFKLYPNPSFGEINIEVQVSEYQTFKVNVYSITGTKVFSTNSDGATQKLDLSHLNKGGYIIEVINNDFRYKKLLFLH